MGNREALSFRPLDLLKIVYRFIIYIIIPGLLFIISSLPLFLLARILNRITGRGERRSLLIVAPDINRIGGYEKQIKVIAPHMAKRFDSAWIISNVEGYLPGDDWEGVSYGRIIYVPPKPRSPVTLSNGYLLFLLRCIRSRNVTVLNFAQSKFSSTIALVSKFMGYRVHSRIASSKDLDLLGRIEPEQMLIKVSLWYSDTILCLNRHIRESLINHGYPGNRLVDWDNAVVPAPGRPLSTGVDEGTEFSFIYAGRLDLNKDVDTVVRAFGYLQKSGVPASLHIYGDGEERQKLYDLTEELGLHETVRFKDEEDISRVLGNYDGAILMSRSEGQSNFLLEAMAHGIPVVGSKVPGIEEIIEDGVNGFLVGPGDYADLAEKIQKLFKDRNLASDMGRKGFEYVEGEHSPEKISGAFAELNGE